MAAIVGYTSTKDEKLKGNRFVPSDKVHKIWSPIKKQPARQLLRTPSLGTKGLGEVYEDLDDGTRSRRDTGSEGSGRERPGNRRWERGDGRG